jgi:DNA-directed RNA polymerase subunit RPC12/RpoP
MNESSYKCVICNKDYKTKKGYEQHIYTQKHKDNQPSIYKCIPCKSEFKDKSNYNRHLISKTHQNSAVEQVKQDPNLIKYVMEQMSKQNELVVEQMSKQNELVVEQMSKQNETMNALVTKVGNTDNSVNHSHNKTFNLQFFLNEQCKDAINWSDFIQNIRVTLEDIDVQSNITDKVIGTICKELDTLGLYKRPIHCTDVKRHKSCIKDNNEWKKDPALLEKGIKLVSGKYQKVINDDCLSTPNWFKYQELTEKIMDRMNVYMKEPEEKCMAEILKRAVIQPL